MGRWQHERRRSRVSAAQGGAASAAINLVAPGVGLMLLGLRPRGAIWLVGFFLLAWSPGVPRARHALTLVLGAFAAVDAYRIARMLGQQVDGDTVDHLPTAEDRR